MHVGSVREVCFPPPSPSRQEVPESGQWGRAAEEGEREQCWLLVLGRPRLVRERENARRRRAVKGGRPYPGGETGIGRTVANVALIQRSNERFQKGMMRGGMQPQSVEGLSCHTQVFGGYLCWFGYIGRQIWPEHCLLEG